MANKHTRVYASSSKYGSVELYTVMIFRYEDKDVWKSEWKDDWGRDSYYAILYGAMAIILAPIYYYYLMTYVLWLDFRVELKLILCLFSVTVMPRLIYRMGYNMVYYATCISCCYVIDKEFLSHYELNRLVKKVSIAGIEDVKQHLEPHPKKGDLEKIAIHYKDGRAVEIIGEWSLYHNRELLKNALMYPKVYEQRIQQKIDDVVEISTKHGYFDIDNNNKDLTTIVRYRNYPRNLLDQLNYLNPRNRIHVTDVDIKETLFNRSDKILYQVDKKDIVSSAIVYMANDVYQIVIVDVSGRLHHLGLTFDTEQDAIKIRKRIIGD